MKDQVREFHRKVDQEETLKKRFMEIETEEELAAIIKEAGFSFTPKDYRQKLKELQQEAGIEQITDDDMDGVVGGLCSPFFSPRPKCFPGCNPSLFTS